ncbi:hypothetical protein [Antribacter gilvus]|uniref:hypothetical protein n=1 Tax=Antribacter gilvus TaxID=2304675 RepID=UPI000F76FFCF|nr:hypothetical protein [Antribacter gilvus]
MRPRYPRLVRRLFRRRAPAGPTAEIYIPIKYDLGGRITDVAAAERAVRALCGEVHPSGSLTRSWNLSFFGRYKPSFSAPLGSGKVTLGGSAWQYERTLVVHPALGVASVNYLLTTHDAGVRLRGFYDDFITWKNGDYAPYVRQTGNESAALREQFQRHPVQEQNLHGDEIVRLRRSLVDDRAIDPRPTTYVFQDFRICFLDRHGTMSRSMINSLLQHRRETPAQHPLGGVLPVDGGRIESTGWSTVLVGGPGFTSRTVDDVFLLMSVVHAHWFVCKLWVNIFDDHIVQSQFRSQRSIQKLRAAQLALATDMTIVGDLEQMLKDPGMLRIAQYFAESFRLPAQAQAAEQRRRVLEEHSRELVEFRSSNLLPMLFAISAAMGLGSIVPALEDVGWPPWITFWTFVAPAVLMSVFALNRASLSERMQLTRSVAKERRARIVARRPRIRLRR